MTVSVVIFALNEERHLPSCLASVKWSDDVVVVDSFSTDLTSEICRKAGARFIEHRFTSMWEQRNWALDHAGLRHDWVLVLDADERVPEALAREIEQASRTASAQVAAYRVKRRFHMWGRWLRYSSLYPTWLVRLIRRERVRYFSQGHGEGQRVQGAIASLKNDLIDENIRGLDDWLSRQNAYSTLDALYELDIEASPIPFRQLASIDPSERRSALKRIGMKLPFRGHAYFLYSYVFRLGFLEGRDGLTFCRMKAMYQDIVDIKKYDLRRRSSGR
jgi:glycosyltransferase involved in cell wall biosynthesis